jgi:hypothetical protein
MSKIEIALAIIDIIETTGECACEHPPELSDAECDEVSKKTKYSKAQIASVFCRQSVGEDRHKDEHFVEDGEK